MWTVLLEAIKDAVLTSLILLIPLFIGVVLDLALIIREKKQKLTFKRLYRGLKKVLLKYTL